MGDSYLIEQEFPGLLLVHDYACADAHVICTPSIHYDWMMSGCMSTRPTDRRGGSVIAIRHA